MSRYSVDLPSGELLIWGFDAPLSEYFIELEASDGECVWSVSNQFSMLCHPKYPGKFVFSRGEMMQFFDDYKEFIPASHIERMALDLPF